MLDNLRDLLRGSQIGTTASVRNLNKVMSGVNLPANFQGLRRGTGLATGLEIVENLVAASGTPYGNKVKAAGEAHQKAKNDAIAYGENFFNNLFSGDGRMAGQRLQQFSDLRGSITPGSMQPAATNLGEGAAMDAAERFRAGAGFPADVTRPDDYPTLLKTPGNSGLNDRGPSAADLFNKYKNQGLDKETAEKKAEDEGMRIWAKTHKELAEKVKEGQTGYDVIQDTLYPKTAEGFDLNPLGTLSVLAKKDPQKALSNFMSANNLVGEFTTASEPIVGSFPQKEYPLMTENYFGFGKKD